MSQYVETPTKAFEAGAAIAQHLRVKLSAGVLAAAGVADLEIGTLDEATFASGDAGNVRLRSAQGTCKMVAAGAIAQGAVVYSAASGKINDVVGKYKLGTALEAATADGDVIEVLRMPAALADLSDEIADPGDAGAIPVVSSGRCNIVTAGAETRTLAIPTFEGQTLLLNMKTDAGNAVITAASAINATGNNTITFADTSDTLLLVGINNNGTLAWRVVSSDGAALSTV